MIVEHLSLVDFRNYAVAEVALGPGPNVFVGRNGQGKTNLAEAIAFFATLGSHRVSNDAPMVRHGADAAIVRARLAHGERHVLLEAQVNRQGSNRARVNGAGVKHRNLNPTNILVKEHRSIAKGRPAVGVVHQPYRVVLVDFSWAVVEEEEEMGVKEEDAESDGGGAAVTDGRELVQLDPVSERGEGETVTHGDM